LNVIELAKDSVANAYPTKGLARYPGSKPKKDKGDTKKGYGMDGGHHSEMARKSSFGKNYHHS
jgi:hypothetical protein